MLNLCRVFAVVGLILSNPALAAAQVTSTAAATANEPDTNYRLGVADKVRITVYNEKEISGEYPVSAGGTIDFPLIGDVPAIGRTTAELRGDIQRKLGDGYFVNPRVSIDVLTFRPYYILGEVNKPGEFPYAANLTAVNAVAAAGGYTYRARKSRIYIKRAGSDVEHAASPDTVIRPGDTIRIGERRF